MLEGVGTGDPVEGAGHPRVADEVEESRGVADDVDLLDRRQGRLAVAVAARDEPGEASREVPDRVERSREWVKDGV